MKQNPGLSRSIFTAAVRKFSLVIAPVFFRCQPDIQGREQGKHVGLNPGYQQLDQADKQHKQGSPRSNKPVMKNERQTHQA